MRPSILLVVADDFRPELGIQGSNVSTPHIDALARRGVRFALAYASWPVCAPSRASMFTSRTPDDLGVYDCCRCWTDFSSYRPTLFRIFRDSGYHTAAFGKVYGPDPGCASLNSELSVPHARLWGHRSGDGTAPGCKRGRQLLSTCQVADESTEPDPGIVAAAVERIRAWSTLSTPWLVYAGLRRTHLPFNAPLEYFERYPAESISLATEQERRWVEGGLDWDNAGELRNGYHDMQPWSDGRSPPRPYTDWMPASKARELRRGYFAAASFLDAMVGRMLSAVDESRPEAIVVVTSDHGWQLGEHQMWTKHQVLEAALRVPFVLSAPSLAHRAGAVVHEPTEALLGLLPTLMELSGVSVPDDVVLQGSSLVPLARGATVTGSACPVRSSSIRGVSIVARLDGGSTLVRYTEAREMAVMYGMQPPGVRLPYTDSRYGAFLAGFALYNVSGSLRDGDGVSFAPEVRNVADDEAWAEVRAEMKARFDSRDAPVSLCTWTPRCSFHHHCYLLIDLCLRRCPHHGSRWQGHHGRRALRKPTGRRHSPSPCSSHTQMQLPGRGRWAPCCLLLLGWAWHSSSHALLVAPSPGAMRPRALPSSSRRAAAVRGLRRRARLCSTLTEQERSMARRAARSGFCLPTSLPARAHAHESRPHLHSLLLPRRPRSRRWCLRPRPHGIDRSGTRRTSVARGPQSEAHGRAYIWIWTRFC